MQKDETIFSALLPFLKRFGKIAKKRLFVRHVHLPVRPSIPIEQLDSY
jgi:hypothetical protein